MASSSTTRGSWHSAGSLDAVPLGGLKTFRKASHQIVLARTSSGEIHALANHCPHEGYPLAQGELSDCLLTCCWHNWKFDIRSGACVLGGEDVRRYPVRIEAEEILVDLSDPDPEVLREKLHKSLAAGLEDGDLSRSVRDGTRLLRAGQDPWQLLGDVAVYDARIAEYGSSHVLAVAADCGRWLSSLSGVEAMHAIAPALDLCADTNRQRKPRPVPAALPGADADSLLEAVEQEQLEQAVGLLRGALAAGTPAPIALKWLHRIVARHFTDFGHQLIYLIKARELLEHLPAEYALEILSGLLWNNVLATREDTLPYLRGYFQSLDERQSELPDLLQRAVDSPTPCPDDLLEAVLEGSAKEAIAALWKALEGGTVASSAAEVLVIAGAERVLRYDASIDQRSDVAENWLWVSHRLTFAAAVHQATQIWPDEDSLRLLFQVVAFVHSGRAMDAPSEQRNAALAPAFEVEDVVTSIEKHLPEQALTQTRQYLAAQRPFEPLRQALLSLGLQAPLIRPIFHAHAIKTTVAALEEYDQVQPRWNPERLVLATVRFLAAPKVERSLRNTVLTSIRWVADGVVPKKLTQ